MPTLLFRILSSVANSLNQCGFPLHFYSYDPECYLMIEFHTFESEGKIMPHYSPNYGSFGARTVIV